VRTVEVVTSIVCCSSQLISAISRN